MNSFPHQGDDWYQVCVSGFEFQKKQDDWSNFATFSNDNSSQEDISAQASVSTSSDKEELVVKEKSHLSSKSKAEKKTQPESSKMEPLYPVSSTGGDQVKVVRIDNSTDWVPLQIGLISAGGGFLALGNLMHPKTKIYKGVLEHECKELLDKFFISRRNLN